MGVSKGWAWLLCIVILLGCAPGTVAQETPPPTAPPERGLWLDISMGPALIDWFNSNAQPLDIARADRVQQAPILNGITAGRRLLVFKSAAEAAEMMPLWNDQVDIIGYNIETGPASPQGEQADPIAGIRVMRELADEYGVGLAVGPDRFFALNYGVEMAPYVDMFVIQVQRIQTEPETVRGYVLPLAAMLRQAHPDIQISVQVRTEGDMNQIVDLVRSLGDSIDGVSILTSVGTVDIAEDLVRKLHAEFHVPETATPLAVLAPGPRVAEAAEETPLPASPQPAQVVPTVPASPAAPASSPTPVPNTPTEAATATAAPAATIGPSRPSIEGEALAALPGAAGSATPELALALAADANPGQAGVAAPDAGSSMPWGLVILVVLGSGVAAALAVGLARRRSPVSQNHD